MHYSTHNLTHHKWYSVWNAMIGRCYRPSQKSYKDYGLRGIFVCEEWKSHPQIFFNWLEDSGYGEGLQIDRKDNDKSYNPENCRVTTAKENSNNRRDNVKHLFDGKLLTVAEISDRSGIKCGTVYNRIKNNIPLSWRVNYRLAV